MGKLKDKIMDNNTNEFALKEEEFNHLMNLNVAKNQIVQSANVMMSSFLHYVATNRLGYDNDDNLQFELDFEDEKRILKVTKLEENFFKKED